jgi:DNA polymerase-3 subunit delta'
VTDETPEADRTAGAPHPRMAAAVFGQDAAAAAFLSAFNAGRLHHAWLLTGQRGVGKATLAWAFARFLLATPEDDGGLFDGGLFAAPPPASLDIHADHPVARRIRALAEPRLFLLRRPWDDSAKRLKAVIPVDEVRRLQAFLRLSAADGGRRAVIVDAADDMNPEAQNALLKLLEEPPRGVTFLMVAHQPMRLLPTIRSRCRALPLAPLTPDALAAALAQAGVAGGDAALAELAGGSAGDAVRLIEGEGVPLYAALVALFTRRPVDRAAALALAEGAGRGEGFDLAVSLIDRLLARAARAGATGALPPEAVPGEGTALARLAPDADAARAVAGLAQTLGARARAGRAVNLDPAALVLDMLLRIDAATAAPARSL